ncbi:acyl-ACP desaturase [Streptomyces kaniharaensis]|uniref:Putative acyl-[acyl-carrier-protein] desaturase DesA1 n=1 Tax=Streptomyces kaniharaensis TaxID=212423 RepID=A0A6N7KVH5_9ACTN|nr:acyl-ACP desaturase [Streptomyces kaniharaensis]MQS14318.1 acyl-ACP desaturase [Streptomyces kaniharaensis]
MTIAPAQRSTSLGSSAWTDTRLILALEEVVEKELDRHLGVAKEWMPHEYVPWSRGRDFDGVLGGEAWAVEQSQVTPLGRVSLVVNLLTEDNLPSYHHEIASMFGREGAWGTWVHRWTAEEGRHGIAIRDFLLATRAVDPVELERARMSHMSEGFESDNAHSMLHSVAYVAFQELATRIAHRNTGKYAGDPLCEQMLAKIANDENLHMVFYRNLLKAALEIAPDQAMRAIADVVTNFRMPGHGIPGFERAAAQIALGGVYNLRIHHDDVLQPVLRHLRVMEIDGLGAEGLMAQDELGVFLDELDGQARKFEERQAAMLARRAARKSA